MQGRGRALPAGQAAGERTSMRFGAAQVTRDAGDGSWTASWVISGAWMGARGGEGGAGEGGAAAEKLELGRCTRSGGGESREQTAGEARRCVRREDLGAACDRRTSGLPMALGERAAADGKRAGLPAAGGTRGCRCPGRR
jgi:hypothetical protein